MIVEKASVVGRARAVIDRRSVGDNHQDASCFGSRDEASMRPKKRFTVDVLFEQVRMEHDADPAAGASPWHGCRLVHDVPEVVEAAGRFGFAGIAPEAPRRAAFPFFGCEAKNLDLYAASLENPRKEVGAERRGRDGNAPHRAGIVDEQRDDGIGEIRMSLAFEGERAARARDHTRETARIEQPFFEVEIPPAALPCEKLPPEPVGEMGDPAPDLAQKVIELAPESQQLFRRRESMGVDDLVEATCIDFVDCARRLERARLLWAQSRPLLPTSLRLVVERFQLERICVLEEVTCLASGRSPALRAWVG